MPHSACNATVDVRELPPRERHPLIFGNLERLGIGERLLLVNDHDPKPLYYLLQAEASGQFDWEYVESGPEVWQVVIARRSAGVVPVTCGCGGQH